MMKLFGLTALIAFVIAFATPAKAWSWPPFSNDDCFTMNSWVDDCYSRCAGFYDDPWNLICPGFAPAWWTKGRSCSSMWKSLGVYCSFNKRSASWTLNLSNRKFRPVYPIPK